MKKHILSFALITAMIAAVATGCSSEKAAGSGTDSTSITDTAGTMSTPMSDTTARDTATKDTTRTNPPQ